MEILCFLKDQLEIPAARAARRRGDFRCKRGQGRSAPETGHQDGWMKFLDVYITIYLVAHPT